MCASCRRNRLNSGKYDLSIEAIKKRVENYKRIHDGSNLVAKDREVLMEALDKANEEIEHLWTQVDGG